jgi:RNA polymerase sigma-70 factor (ECF subfamily)
MTSGPDEDAELMLRAQRGDLEAFEQIVNRHRQAILNFVQRTLRDPDESEDVAQQTFVQAWKAAGRYRAASRLSTWLFTIARNLCLNELRRRGRHPADSLDAPKAGVEGAEHDHDHPDTRGPGVADEVLIAELEDKIEEALRDLPETQRSAILLFREKDLSYEDIARVLDTSVSATKSLIHRGRETLKKRLKPYLRTGAWDDEPGARETFPQPRF